jgi:hypothetical protein
MCIYKPDYGIMHFVVIDVNSESYKVLANGDEAYFIKKDTSFLFIPWGRFFEEKVLSVRDIVTNQLFDVKYMKEDTLIVTNPSTGKQLKVRWREGNELKIELLMIN